MNVAELQRQIEGRWPADVQFRLDLQTSVCELTCSSSALAELCGRLFLSWGFSFAGLIVEEGSTHWLLRYCFYGEQPTGWVHVLAGAPLGERTFPSIVKFVHAADWHEREAEDMFGLFLRATPF
jgi:Ni,Fe-hydrogenase III component G